MSRNFELLKALETEVDQARLAPGATDGLVKQISTKQAGDLFGEEIVLLVQAVFLSANRRTRNKVVFCGVEAENGSNTVCAAAGRALTALSDKSVCLVDANVRSPRLSASFGINASIPCSTHPASMREQCAHINGNLWLAGTDLLTDDFGSLLEITDLKQRLAQLESCFDYLLVDAPGAGVGRDAALLGEVTGAAILVIEANSTRRETARRAKDSLEAAGVPLLGTVLRNRSFPIPPRFLKQR